ncbi:MAG: 30S ribosome-binding factor RbfA [Lachnospiraceae bacterium]|jgi:ribosome-binding factor A|nr:30S ribosome-binding factor RbfA [Lachnospiraceae bacterium]
MQRKNTSRMNRIDEELKKELSNIISYELKNSKITGLVSVTKVKTTPDLRYARVYVSILNSKNKKDTLEGLTNGVGYMRSKIAERINLRITPEIVIQIDESAEYGAKIDSIINELKKK